MNKTDAYRNRRYKRLLARMDAADGHFDDEGRWITTEEGHHVHLNKSGKPDKGNPHVVSKMTTGKNLKDHEKDLNKAFSSGNPVKAINTLINFPEGTRIKTAGGPTITRGPASSDGAVTFHLAEPGKPVRDIGLTEAVGRLGNYAAFGLKVSGGEGKPTQKDYKTAESNLKAAKLSADPAKVIQALNDTPDGSVITGNDGTTYEKGTTADGSVYFTVSEPGGIAHNAGITSTLGYLSRHSDLTVSGPGESTQYSTQLDHFGKPRKTIGELKESIQDLPTGTTFEIQESGSPYGPTYRKNKNGDFVFVPGHGYDRPPNGRKKLSEDQVANVLDMNQVKGEPNFSVSRPEKKPKVSELSGGVRQGLSKGNPKAFVKAFQHMFPHESVPDAKNVSYKNGTWEVVSDVGEGVRYTFDKHLKPQKLEKYDPESKSWVLG